MAAATLAEIRAGLETRLATIPEVTTSAYMLENPPGLTLQVMGPDRVEYDKAAQRGHDNWTFIVQGFSGSPESRAAQTNLDAWLDASGPNSVKAALEGDRGQGQAPGVPGGALGGLVDDIWVFESTGYQEYHFKSGVVMLGAHWSMLILNSGT